MINFEKFTNYSQEILFAANAKKDFYKNTEVQPEHIIIAIVEDNGIARDYLTELKLLNQHFINEIVAKIKEKTGISVKTTTLGHIQRGGTPTAHDRVLSSRYGYAAVELCMKGGFGRMVALQGDQIVDVSLEDVIGQKTKNVDPNGELVTLAKAMGVCFGD
jgi:6-phosphofructokinase